MQSSSSTPRSSTTCRSFFNDALYIRKSVPDGIRTIGRGKLITIDANANANVIVDDLTPDGQREALVTTFGLSEEIADRLPPDSTEGLALG